MKSISKVRALYHRVFLQKRYPTTGESVNCLNVALQGFVQQTLVERIKKIVLGMNPAVDVKYKVQQYVIKAIGMLKREDFNNDEYQRVDRGNQTYLKKSREK